ncbi:MAG: formamidopyrimidine-DNA glycosylase [Chloroflexi bacterium]|nr:formamidopyrimidine-DNA glycosylase [Chloroflexota bacterium]
MPELPDVEAMRRYLLSQDIVGSSITGTDLYWPSAIKAPSPERFVAGLVAQRVASLERRGKFLLFGLDGQTLVLHLRMTGSLVMAPEEEPYHRFVRNVLLLDSGKAMWFVDPRKLGMMWLVKDVAPVIGHLGPEPLEPEFTPEVLAGILRGKGLPIKVLLCEQSAMAGIGNIYADEILFCAGLHPERKAEAVSFQEIQALHECTVTVLREATERLSGLLPIPGPPTESAAGAAVLKVPRSYGAGCPHCGTSIQRLVIRGRSAYLCPRCQQ